MLKLLLLVFTNHTDAMLISNYQSRSFDMHIFDSKDMMQSVDRRGEEVRISLDASFQTARAVVDHALSEGSSKRPLLRRIQTFNIDMDDVDTDYASELFEPLFGPYHNVTCMTSMENDRIHKKSKRKRINLKLTVAYRGSDFCGWEDQRHHLYRRNSVKTNRNQTSNQQPLLPSVQGTLVDILDPIFGKKATVNSRNDVATDTKFMPIEIKVAGRTDAGVSALAQICRIRTWRSALPGQDSIDEVENYVKELVNEHAIRLGLGLRITNVDRVGDAFHPTFCASCRAYAYLIDLQNEDTATNKTSMRDIVPKLDEMLRSLEGHSLDYFAFSYGKVKTQTTICTLFRARASIVESSKRQAICIELMGDRFLRRMVRILVATALRQACVESNHQEALLDVLSTKDRTYADRAAAPDGLIFVGAAYIDTK